MSEVRRLTVAVSPRHCGVIVSGCSLKGAPPRRGSFAIQPAAHSMRTMSFGGPFAPLLTKAELPHVRFHDLRHTAATLLLAAGVHPKVVQERLGDATIGMTLDTYSHVLPTMQRDAAEKIGGLFRRPR